MAIQRRSLYLSVLLLSSCSFNQVLEDSYAERFQSKGLNHASIYDLQNYDLLNVPKPQVKHHLLIRQVKEKATAALLYSAPQSHKHQIPYSLEL
jgi:hypothetical protein